MLGALVVARAGRPSCAALGELLRGWDGTMTVLMRGRICRHIEDCEVCGQRKRFEVRPAMLRGLAPPALLPPGLRIQVLGLCASRKREALVRRTGIVDRAGGFGSNGFPAALARPGSFVWRPGHRRVAMAAGAATVAAAVIATATVLATGDSPGRHSGGQTAAGPASPGGTPGRVVLPSPPGRHGAAPPPVSARSAGGTAPPGAGVPARELEAALGTGARSSGGNGTSAGSKGSGEGSGGAGTGGISPAGAGTGGGGTGSVSGTGGASAGTGTATVSVTPGVLVLASLLGGPATGTLTLTAGDVPVTHYTISIPSGLIGKLSVSPASGSIGAGQSVRVTVTLVGLLSVGTTISVNPGGHSVTVLLGAG